MTFSPLELNAYLDRLTEDWDEEAARSIVAAFHNLPIPNSRRVVQKSEKTEGATFEGYTQEAGNVSLSDRAVKHTTKGENAEEYRRVGFYKVRRVGREGSEVAMVVFLHFQNADLSTRTPKPEFGVEYFTETLEPYALVVFESIEEEPPLRFKIGHVLRSLRTHLLAALRGREVTISYIFYKIYGRTLYGTSRMGHNA